MRTRRGAARAFTGRLGIALTTTAILMIGAVLAVNYVIDVKLSAVARVGLHTAGSSGTAMNFLVVGSDSRAFTAGNKTAQQQFGNESGNGGQRSDTMMVIRVDPDHGRTLVVSFPRDLWVNVPGQGMQKINAAYNAGPQRVIDMLKQDFNISINHFVQVDFKSFQGVVNAIGTIPVYVPYEARDDKTGLYQPVPGCEMYSGADALAYVRSRELQYYSPVRQRWLPADAVPDINRIARQQQFIRRLAEIAVKKGLNDPLTGNAILNRVLENLTIDSALTKSDILTLVDAFRHISPTDSGHVQFSTMPWGEGPTQGGGQSVLYVKEPSADGVVTRLGGTVNPTDVAILTGQGTVVVNGQVQPVISSGTSGGSGSTSSTTAPGTTRRGTGVTPTTAPTSTTTRRAGTVGRARVAAPATTTTTTTLPLNPTTTTTLPGSPTTTATTAPSGPASPTIENQSLFGPAAPKTPPCA
jgi:LCP family protein required for cell wall assembly